MSINTHFPNAELLLFRPIQLEPISGCDGSMQGKEALLHVAPRKSLGISEGEIFRCMCWMIPGLDPVKNTGIFSDNRSFVLFDTLHFCW